MCVGFPLGIAGVVLFVLSTRNGNGADAKAVIGLILSIVGFILSAISAVFIIIAILNSPDTDRNYYIMTVYLTTLIMITIRLTMTMITKTYLTNMTTAFLSTTKVTDLTNFNI